MGRQCTHLHLLLSSSPLANVSCCLFALSLRVGALRSFFVGHAAVAVPPLLCHCRAALSHRHVVSLLVMPQPSCHRLLRCIASHCCVMPRCHITSSCRVIASRCCVALLHCVVLCCRCRATVVSCRRIAPWHCVITLSCCVVVCSCCCAAVVMQSLHCVAA
jgi:hypothetical protein